jgi:hypothetical protein
MGDRRGAYWVWLGDLVENYYFEDLDIDGITLLKLLLRKWDWETWTGLL